MKRELGEARGSFIEFFTTKNTYNFRGKFLIQKKKRGIWAKMATDRMEVGSPEPQTRRN